MNWNELAQTARKLLAKSLSAYAAIERRMNRRRWLFAGIAVFLVFLFYLTLARRGMIGQTAYIVRPVATAVYSERSAFARDDEILYGMMVVVTGRADALGYVPARTEYGYDVRIHVDDVAAFSSIPETWWAPHTHFVSGMFADITLEAGLKAYPSLMTLPRNARLWVTAEEGDYATVRLHDGGTGYVRRSLIRERRAWDDVDETTRRREVVEDALAYLGVPYRWGGKTPMGIDCSGLASMAYMANGLAIHRNSRAQPGFPIALMYVDMPPDGHNRESLLGVKPGDLLYWEGHQGIYLGDGRYIHANATSYSTGINSLIKGDDGYREDLAVAGTILAWGTAFPVRPGALEVRKFVAVPTDSRGGYRFFARIDGYAPTKATIYPEGMGAGKPNITVNNPTQMVCGAMEATNSGTPEYVYAKPGDYRPVVVFANLDGWLPDGKTITSEPCVMPMLEVRF